MDSLTLARTLAGLPRGGFRAVRALTGLRPELRHALVPVRVSSRPMVCDLSEAVCFPVLKHGGYPHTQDEEAFYRRHISANDVVYDIGANIGYTALLFSGIARQVVAFEPAPRALRLLDANTSQLGNVTVVPLALSDAPGVVRFSEEHCLDESHISETGVAVEAARLDDIPSLPKPAFLKIDVEGHEPAVFRGAERLLRECRPLILFEALNSEALEACIQAIRAAEPDYRIFTLNEGGEIREGGENAIPDAVKQGNRVFSAKMRNFVASVVR